jgi:hypothetical protein
MEEHMALLDSKLITARPGWGSGWASLVLFSVISPQIIALDC